LSLLNLLSVHKSTGSKARIIFPSTRLVYKGQKGIPLQEEAEKEFKTVYAINKFACEKYLSMWGNAYQTPYTILRLCVPYGNLLDSAYSYGTLGFFLSKASVGEPITLYGDGSLQRTFSHVADVCQYFLLAAKSDDFLAEIFNIPGDNHSLKEVANLIADRFQSEVTYSPFPDMDRLIESGDTIFDGSKIIQTTGYQYQHSLSEWIKDLQ